MHATRRNLIAGLCIALAGCASQPAHNLTPLQIETMQTRAYETDKDTLFAGIVSVFQTLGYTIKLADKDTGIITAEGLSKETAPGFWDIMVPVLWRVFVGDIFYGRHTNIKAQSTSVLATAFIEDGRAGTSRVRLNFVATRFIEGGSRSEQQILKPAYYQNAFEKIANAIFIRSSTK